MKYLLPAILILNQLSVHVFGQCIPTPNVTPGPQDPPFPTLPDTFMTRIEANLKDRQKSITTEEYVDVTNNRATIKLTSGGSTILQLLDYKNDQLIYIDDAKHCEVMNLSLSQNTILFGTATQKGGVPHMFTTNGILHFMQSSGQSYKGSDYVRGVNVDHWQTCLIWKDLNATFTLDYYFAAQSWNTPIGFPQIPVRAIATGVQVLANGTNYQFQHFYEYIDFRVDISDYSVFNIPKGVYCDGKKSSRSVPTVTSSLHFKAELVSPQTLKIYTYEYWYDAGLNLVRYDYQSTGVQFTASDPIIEVHDFTSGIRYVTDRVTGNCTIMSINNDGFFDGNSGQYGQVLKSASQFLFLDSNFVYSGTRTVRGAPCDVFTAKRLFPFNGVLYNATVDYYFLSSGFTEYPSDGSTAPSNIPFKLEATLNVPDMDDLFLSYNILSYDTEKRSVSDFDVSACYKNMKSLRFQVRLPGPFRQQDTDLLITQAQNVLPSIMNVTKIRIQDMRVDFDPSTVYLTSTLVDIAPDSAKFMFSKTVQIPSGTVTSTKDVDRSFDFTTTWQDCATFCIQSFDFICNSLDFCPNTTTGNCHLYKDRRTNIDVFLKAHSPPCVTYSIYQRTVNGKSNQETAILDAYGYLQDAINKKAVHLQTFDPMGVVTDYYAVETEIISGVLEPQNVMPSMSGQFSYREEITFPGLKNMYASDVWYDYNFKLARYDLVNTGAPYYTNNPLIHIHDYNAGVAYVIDSGMQNCTIKQIDGNFFDLNQNGTYSMKNPLDVFNMNRTYQFVGQKTVRGMTCNVFEATVDNFKLNMNDPDTFNSTFQYYFLKDDWTSNSDSSFGTSSAQPIRLDILSVEKGLYITYNYYDWNNLEPDLNNFNIVPCYTGDQQKHFVIVFNGQYYPYLSSNSKTFKLMVQNQLGQMTNASLIRFQQPQIDYGLTHVYVIMTVVEQAPAFGAGPYQDEPDIDSILQTINNNVYQGLLSIAVPQSDGSIYTFNAVAITDDILRNDGRPLSSQTMSHFKVMKNKSQKSLAGFLSGISVDECADSCLSNLEFDCYSFVYCPRTGMCSIAQTYAQQRPDLIYDRPNCDLYYRSYIDKFTAVPGQISSVSSQRISITATAEVCAQKCMTDAITCNSFLYCMNTQTCSLLQTHTLDISKSTNNDSVCSFYSRSYLNDFKRTARSTMQFTQVLDIAAVSVDQCAQLCIQTEALSCNSFAFCGNSTTCRLTAGHPSRGMKVVATDYCDLYTRTYYEKSTQKQIQASSASTGYSSGAMAGVAIGLLIIGIIFGGGCIVVLSKKRKLPPLEMFNMNYTEHKESVD